MSRLRSPKYPSYPLKAAIENVRKVYDADRTAALPREVIAKHLGYSGLSGASDTSIATIVQYGLLERTGKGEMKVSKLAVDILMPETPHQQQEAINRAALSPPLFSEIWNHFEKRQPSPEALRTYLYRREFQDRAIDPVLKSFAPTIDMMKQQNESESGGAGDDYDEEAPVLPSQTDHSEGARASIGDYIQWESQGVLQFKKPRRVRWVSEDGDWLAIEGENTGIPMNEVTIENAAVKNPPFIPPVEDGKFSGTLDVGFTEWFRAKVGSDKLVTINYKGADEIGPREIEKMIAILEAQKLALED